jgi:pimeloyl-ACP methyl ester carboxylesterase
MFGLLILTGALAAASDKPEARCFISPTEFRAWFDTASKRKLTIPDDVSQRAARYRYVLINGLDIGFTQGCFVQNAKELRAIGVPRKAIHFIDPSSRGTVAENAASVRSEIESLAALGPEKLVLIGHSRGACAVLAFALESPEFVAKRVHALFLIQGPFGGTAVADYVVGEGSAMDKRMPPVARVAGQVMGRLESSVLNQGKRQVITSMTRKASDNFWDDLMETNVDAIPTVGPKTFYVTSRTSASRHPLLQRVTAHYLGAYYGPNDGVVALEDQTIPGLGTVLATLDAGHTDLTHRFPSARPSQRLRRALVDAIIMAVGSSTEPGSRPARIAQGRSADKAH